MTRDIVVIGSGFGGLSTAILLGRLGALAGRETERRLMVDSRTQGGL